MMPTVLVVDDDKAVQDLLVDLLEERGYATRTARDGRQVLAEVVREPVQLVILDVLIPHMNGFAVIEQIRATPELRDLPVIMISGIYRSRNHRADMASRFGIIEYFDKPLQTSKLLDLVDQVVKGAGAEPVLLGGVTGEPTQEKTDEPVLLEEVREPLLDTEPPPAAGLDVDAELVDIETEHEKDLVESEARESFRTSAFVLQGYIKKTPVVAVLGKLWHQRVTGALLLRRDKIKKIVYLERGDPYLVKSNLVSECLGQVLMRERLITREQCELSIERMRDSGQKQGEILVAMGALTEKNLSFALDLQLETKLFETFAWSDGEFRFNSSVPLAASGARMQSSGAAVVVEGIRRTFDETRLRRLMLPVLDVPLVFAEGAHDFAAMRFTQREAEAISAITPPKTTRVLLESLPLDPVDALRVVYSLIALEILKPAA
ncbi:MAG: response regulator [Deltaproteobacteria bacterium]|nr:response regulator [Deltaproteobacteria bacterium]